MHRVNRRYKMAMGVLEVAVAILAWFGIPIFLKYVTFYRVVVLRPI